MYIYITLFTSSIQERYTTPRHRLGNSIFTLKDKNKGSRIICCHTPILINNSVLDYAVSPVEIGICLEAMTERRVQLTTSLLRPVEAAGAETPRNRI